MNKILCMVALAVACIAAPAMAQVAPAGDYAFNFASANYSGNGTLTVGGNDGVVTLASGSIDDNGIMSAILGVAPVGTYASNDNVLLAAAPFVTLNGLDLTLADGNTFNLFTYFDGKNYESNVTVNPTGTDANGALTGSQQLTSLDVAAVPEPATWAMMLVGFGAIGFSMRRKRSALIPQLA